MWHDLEKYGTYRRRVVTHLRKRALARPILKAEQVQAAYNRINLPSEEVLRLCESHERLRAIVDLLSAASERLAAAAEQLAAGVTLDHGPNALVAETCEAVGNVRRVIQSALAPAAAAKGGGP